MSLESLAPANTQKARATGVSAFARFLREQDVSEDFVHASIQSDPSGARLVMVVDRFGLHLACKEGNDGKPLSKNSVMSYYRNVKLWLLDVYPTLRTCTKNELMRKGKTLERYCQKRTEGGHVNKATSCRKEDLCALIECLYTNASCANDYQDAALLCLMWHCFGRASDLGFLWKEHVSMPADGAVCVKLLRVKTSSEQGLTIVPDRSSYLACPLTALAVALAMQETPSGALLCQLPALIAPVAAAIDLSATLHELLDADPLDLSADRQAPSTKPPSRIKVEVGIHGYVTRLLRRLETPDLEARRLTSHSFRRGGAQHASGDDRLAAQWILDRGAWNMSAANKGFAYVFNTPQEDRKVARVLSGWAPDERPKAADASSLDSRTRAGLDKLKLLLFDACSGQASRRMNVDSTVLSSLTATLVLQYPSIKALNQNAPIAKRIESCVLAAGYTDVDLVSWSAALSQSATPAESETQNSAPTASAMCGHDAAVINELITMNRKLSERLRVCEAALLRLPGEQHKRTREDNAAVDTAESVAQEPKRRKKSPASNLSSVWYAWYTSVPRTWDGGGDRKRRSDARLLVAFLKLFLPNGFVLEANSVAYKDAVLATGKAAEAALLAFLRERSFKPTGFGTVVKELRRLHRAGVLNALIESYRLLLRTHKITDPSPKQSQDILAPCTQG